MPELRKEIFDIVIPTYNRIGYLKEALDSALSQNFHSFNVIVIDSNSTDGTREYLSSISHKRFSYHLYDDNKGLFGNINRALQHAKSQYISLFHDDDVMLPDFLRLNYEVFRNSPNVVFAHCAVVEIDSLGEVIRERQRSILKEVANGDMFLREILKNPEKVSIVAPSVTFKKEVIDCGELFDEKMIFWGDLDYWIRISKYGCVAYLDIVLMKYRIHNLSGSSTVLKGVFEDRLNDRLRFENSTIKELKNRGGGYFFNKLRLYSLVDSRILIDLFYQKKNLASGREYLYSIYLIFRLRPRTALRVAMLLKILLISMLPLQLLNYIRSL